MLTRLRDGLLTSTVALTTLGPVVAALARPDWHHGWMGGLELVFFVFVAAAVGVVVAGVAAAPPSRWGILRRASISMAMATAVLTPVTLFGFRLVRGVSLLPYHHQLTCSSESPSHVMVLAMLLMPLVAFMLGMASAVTLRLMWQRAAPRRAPWWLRAAIVCALTTAAVLIAAPLIVSSPWSCLAVCAAIGLAPLLAGDRALSAATLMSLASATLLGLYL